MKFVRRKLTFLLLAFSSLQFPDQPVFASEFRFATVEKVATQNADWQEKASSFLSPQSVFYALGLLLVMGLCLFTAIDLVFKAVFVACTVGVYWATYNYSLHRPLTNTQTESVSIWVHGIGRSAVLRNVPCKTECTTVYDLVSRVTGVPSQMLTLSTGVKILQRKLPLSAYTSCVDLSHGFSLHCCIRLLGGGSDDEDEVGDSPNKKKHCHAATTESETTEPHGKSQKGVKLKGQPSSIFKLLQQRKKESSDRPTLPTLSELFRLKVPERVGTHYHIFGIILLNDEDGSLMESIISNHRGNSVDITIQILQQWLRGRGKRVSWETLIRTLRDCDLTTLAATIEAVKLTDSDESQSMLEEAMKEGYVNVSVVKLIIVGPAGVGKTCLYYLLLSKPPPKPEDRTSTGCAERPVRVIQVGGMEDGKWKEVDLKQMVAETVPILCKKIKIEKSAQIDQDLGGQGDVVVDDHSVDSEEDQGTEFDRAIEEVISELYELIELNIKSPLGGFELTDEAQASLEKQAIYITDSGGQQSFWDLVPVFMHGNSSTLFVHRLCDKLDDYPLNELFKDGQRVGPEQRATLTTAQAFKMMCQGIQPGDESQIFVIGTHRDMGCTEKDKNKKLKDMLPRECNAVYCGQAMDNLIFDVNTGSPDKRDKEMAKNIREKVKALSQNHRVPLRLYILQLIMEQIAWKLGRQVFTMDECKDIAVRLGFQTEEQLEYALEFFDKLNIFFYKKHVLPNVVFTSSQVPLKAVTELVKKRYHLLAAMTDASDCIKPMDSMWLDFRDKARVTSKHLQDAVFQPHYQKGIFTAMEFLDLLEGLLVIAPISKSEHKTEYFCPSLLKMVEVDALLAKGGIVTRVVNFPAGCAPPGVFCCAVCYLQSKCGWNILEEDTIARNKVTFAVLGREVTFIDKFQFFAVCIDQCNIRPKRCQQLSKDVFKAIEEALKTTHQESTLFGLSFLCPCRKIDSLHPATVEQDEDEKILICSKTTLMSATLTEAQGKWQEMKSAGTSEPTALDLENKVIRRISSDALLHLLALKLGLDEDDISIIETDLQNDISQRVRAVFKHWKRTETRPYTWAVLISALRSDAVQLKRLATELEQWLDYYN